MSNETPPRLRDGEPTSSWYDTTRAYLGVRADLREVLSAETTSGDRSPTQATLTTSQ